MFMRTFLGLRSTFEEIFGLCLGHFVWRDRIVDASMLVLQQFLGYRSVSSECHQPHHSDRRIPWGSSHRRRGAGSERPARRWVAGRSAMMCEGPAGDRQAP